MTENTNTPQGTKTVTTKIPFKTWLAIIILGLAGQIAWNVENSWFNTFVYDEITPDPTPIAWMVAVSAVVSTLTTFVMGTWSDRMGKRKPFLVLGYILWGISTAAFPTAVFFKVTGIVILMVIILDAVMGFFGSTANDAVFNAWVTDVTDETNRGRVQGFLVILPVLVTAITAAIGGLLIENFGYFTFFYALGGLVLLAGLVVQFLVKESPDLQPSREQTYWKQLTSVFEWKTISENRVLFLLFLAILMTGISGQISTPYLFIYLEHFAGISKTMIGLVALVLTLISGLVAIGMSFFIDRWDRRRTAITLSTLAPIGIVIFANLRSLTSFYILGSLYVAPGMLAGIVIGAWMMDLYPKDSRGRFQGVRMVFQVMLPMVIGPWIGSWVIAQYGTPTTLNGEAGFIPSPYIFYATALVSLLAIIPIYLTSKVESE